MDVCRLVAGHTAQQAHPDVVEQQRVAVGDRPRRRRRTRCVDLHVQEMERLGPDVRDLVRIAAPRERGIAGPRRRRLRGAAERLHGHAAAADHDRHVVGGVGVVEGDHANREPRVDDLDRVVLEHHVVLRLAFDRHGRGRRLWRTCQRCGERDDQRRGPCRRRARRQSIVHETSSRGHFRRPTPNLPTPRLPSPNVPRSVVRASVGRLQVNDGAAVAPCHPRRYCAGTFTSWRSDCAARSGQ